MAKTIPSKHQHVSIVIVSMLALLIQCIEQFTVLQKINSTETCH